MSISRPVIVALVALLAVLCSVAPASAAPVAWESVDISLHDDDGTRILLVGGVLPDSAVLPAQVELPVPKGGQLIWAGEILGGDPSLDPDVALTTRTAGDSDIYAFTLTQARRGQVEIVVPDAVTFDGVTYSADLSWTPVADTAEVAISVLVPPSAQIVTPAEGAALVEGEGGLRYYRMVASDARAGTPVRLAFSYTASAGASAAPRQAGDSNVLLVLLFVAAAGVGSALLYARGAARARGEAAGDDSGEPGADGPEARIAEADDAPGEEAGEPAAPGRGGSGRARLIAGVVIVVLLGGAAFAVSAGSKPKVVGDRIVREFLGGDACTSASIALSGDPAKRADEIMAAIQGAGAMRAEIVPAEGRVEVAFCDSQTSEQAIRAALAPLGVLKD